MIHLILLLSISLGSMLGCSGLEPLGSAAEKAGTREKFSPQTAVDLDSTLATKPNRVRPDTLLMKFAPAAFKRLKSTASGNTGIDTLDLLNQKHGAKVKRLIPERANSNRNLDIFRWHLIKLSSAADNKTLEELSKEYRQDPNIESVEFDHELTIDTVPNDPYYSLGGSWGQSFKDLWGLHMIQAEAAWDLTTGSPGVVVASIDSGVDRNHPDLAANMWVNEAEIPANGIDDDGNGLVDDYHGWDWVSNDTDPMDDNGHGTHTAGTMAGMGNNNLGMTGVTWNSKIMALKIIGSSGTGYTSSAVAALIYAADHGAKVSNLSWGGFFHSQSLEDAVNYEHDLGMTVVAAAGNNGGSVHSFYPAALDRVITVAASESNDNVAWFSNYGEKIDVAAPGVEILSVASAINPLCLNNARFVDPDKMYCRLSGTSMAAPHVTGLAALLLSRDTTLKNEEIRQIVRIGADDIDDAGRDNFSGHGRINASLALQDRPKKLLSPILIAPRSRQRLSSVMMDIVGRVEGDRFVSYRLEAGLGTSPTNWIMLSESFTQPVANQVLLSFNGTTLANGKYTFRLRALDEAGHTYDYQVYNVVVEYFGAAITSPAGSIQEGTYPIVGSAFTRNGLIFSNYTLEYGEGFNPTEWRTDAITLYNNGTIQIADAGLGSINTDLLLEGHLYTIRLTVHSRNGPTAKAYRSFSVLDTTPPSISLTSPSSGVSVTNPVVVSADAMDNYGIAEVCFHFTGNYYPGSTCVWQAPWSATITMSPGERAIYAIARDFAGNTATSPQIEINVLDTEPPDVYLLSNQEGALLSGVASIEVVAYDNSDNWLSSGISGVEVYFDDGEAVPAVMNSGIYVASWNTVTEMPGVHYLQARATDVAGNSALSTRISVNVLDQLPPSQPTNLRTVSLDYNRVALAWDVSTDNLAVVGYRVMRDGVLKATVGTLGSYTDSSVQPRTSYSYQVLAYDAAGNVSPPSNQMLVKTPSAPSGGGGGGGGGGKQLMNI